MEMLLVPQMDQLMHIMKMDHMHIFSSNHIIRKDGKLSPHNSVTSQQAEHYGVLGILLLLLLFSIQSCTLQQSFPPVTVWINNFHTQQCLENPLLSFDSIKYYVSTDIDLWQLMNFLFISITSKWVKAHQDDNTPVALLPPEEKMNVLANTVASKLYQFSPPQPQCCPHDDKGVFLVHKGKHIVDIERSIKIIVHKPDFMNYICQKRNWDTTTYNSILWKSLSSAIKRFKQPSCLNVLQLIHN